MSNLTALDVSVTIEREGDEHNRKVIRVHGNRIECTHPFYEPGSQLEVDRSVFGYERDLAEAIRQLQNEVSDLRAFINGMRGHVKAAAAMYGLTEKTDGC